MLPVALAKSYILSSPSDLWAENEAPNTAQKKFEHLQLSCRVGSLSLHMVAIFSLQKIFRHSCYAVCLIVKRTWRRSRQQHNALLIITAKSSARSSISVRFLLGVAEIQAPDRQHSGQSSWRLLFVLPLALVGGSVEHF